MQDQIYNISVGLDQHLTYGQEYAHIKWRVNIADILQEMISEINQNFKASKVDYACWN